MSSQPPQVHLLHVSQTCSFQSPKNSLCQGGWKPPVSLRQLWRHFQAALPKKSHTGLVNFLHNSHKPQSRNTHSFGVIPVESCALSVTIPKGSLWETSLTSQSKAVIFLKRSQHHPMISVVEMTLFEPLLRSNIWIQSSATTFRSKHQQIPSQQNIIPNSSYVQVGFIT